MHNWNICYSEANYNFCGEIEIILTSSKWMAFSKYIFLSGINFPFYKIMYTKIGCAGRFKNCNPIDKIKFFKLRPLRVSKVTMSSLPRLSSWLRGFSINKKSTKFHRIWIPSEFCLFFRIPVERSTFLVLVKFYFCLLWEQLSTHLFSYTNTVNTFFLIGLFYFS